MKQRVKYFSIEVVGTDFRVRCFDETKSLISDEIKPARELKEISQMLYAKNDELTKAWQEQMQGELGL